MQTITKKSHYFAVVVSFFLLFFSPLAVLAQDAQPDCQGIEVVSGLGEDIGAQSAETHRVTIRITDSEAVRDTIGDNMVAYVFYGTGSGERYYTNSGNLIPTQILSNQVTTTFTFDDPIGSPAEPSDWAYVYLYSSTSRFASAKCTLGFYQRQVTGGEPASPPINNQPPIDQIPHEPIFPVRHVCGEIWEQEDGVDHVCECTDSATGRQAISTRIDTQMCCGWNINGRCSATVNNTSIPPTSGGSNSGGTTGGTTGGTSGGTTGGGGGGDLADASSPELDIFGPTADNFRKLNPLRDSAVGDQLASPGGIVTRILTFAFPLAGLILFVMIVWGGFEMLTSAATSKGVDAGRQRVTNALVGFIILFCSYWIIQIIQVVFGVAIV